MIDRLSRESTRDGSPLLPGYVLPPRTAWGSCHSAARGYLQIGQPIDEWSPPLVLFDIGKRRRLRRHRG